MLTDKFSRSFYYLRLSVTDVCNFKCQYCLPDGSAPDPSKHFLTIDEIRRLVTAFAATGTNKVRITGGEPTLRKDIDDIIRTVAEVDGIDTVAMTTNAYRLAKKARDWNQAGVKRINISLDSLDSRQFGQITGTGTFDKVMAGIDAALEAGFEQVKVNSVLLRELGPGVFEQFLDWSRHQPIEIRFIELMQTGDNKVFFDREHYSGEMLKNRLLSQGWTAQKRASDAGPATVLTHPDHVGRIGFILPYEKDFCDSCNRLRVSAEGNLHLCLFGEQGLSIREYLQDDRDKDALIAQLQHYLGQKKQGHFLHDGDPGGNMNLASIGG